MDTKEEKELSSNFFYNKFGNRWKRKESPLSENDFLELLLRTKNFCDSIEKIEIEKFNSHYKKYLEIFKFQENFPVYKKSGLHKVLFLCSNNTKIEFYTDRCYKIEFAVLKLKERQNTVSLESFISKYGEKEGNLRYSEYLKKWKETISKHDKKELYKNWKNKPEYYLNKINPSTNIFYTLSEAKSKIKDDLSKGFKNLWKKYKNGEIEKSFCNCTIDYYTKKGMTLDEARIALFERQSTFSLEKCIEKWGYEEGLEKFKKRNEKWINSLNSKSENEKMDIHIRKVRNLPRFSKVSSSFFEDLILRSKSYIGSMSIFYGINEMILWDRGIKRPFFYDFSIPEIKLIIEYNGSLFHPNLDKMDEKSISEWRCLYTKQTAEEKYKNDEYKINFAKKLGYLVHVVWDTDNYESSIEECKKIIKNRFYDYKRNYS